MARRRKITEQEFKTHWHKLPRADRQFVSALILIHEAVGDGRLRYHELSPARQRSLRRADRDTLFSIITVCLGLLTHAPALQRIRKVHQRRAARARRLAPPAQRRPRCRKPGRR